MVGPATASVSVRASSRVAVTVAAAALIVAVLGASASAMSPDPLSPEERAWLAEHGPIRFAPDPNYPPFEWRDERGNVTGINVDLLNRMSRNLNFEYEVVHYENWTVILEAMARGEVDLLGSTASTPEREPLMDFVGPYMRVGEVFYVRSDGPAYRTPEDLVGKKVAVIPNYAAATWLKENHPQLTIVPVPDMEAGLARLSVGEVDAFFENIPVGGFYIRENSLNNIRIMGEPLYYSEANWVVPEGEAILAAIIEEGMASIPLGEQTKIFEYWTGYDLGFHPDTAATVISPLARNLILGAVAVAAVAGAWSVSLRRTVGSRTRDLAKSKQELERVNRRLEEDVRRRAEAEREVRRLNEGLEARVRTRTEQLTKANRDLEAFSYSLSHDLRTPLSALTGYTEVLKRKYVPSLDADGKRYVERMIASERRMGQIIEDVLRLSTASKASMAREVVDLGAIAERTLAALREKSPERRVTAVVAPSLTAFGDAQLLEIAIDNLVGNAWKYTRRTEDARIEVGVEPSPEGPVYFVRDNGAGFDPEEAHRLFQPFQRLHSASEFEGTGIGLSTVDRIVERHGGRIWATGEPGKGATFRFTMGGSP